MAKKQPTTTGADVPQFFPETQPSPAKLRRMRQGSGPRNKGASAERDVVRLLQPVVNRAYEQLAYDAPALAVGTTPRLQRNSLQADGGGCDIVGLPWLALEVKHQERKQVPAWWKQCVRQAREDQTPVLFYRSNGEMWTVRMAVSVSVVGYRPAWTPVVEMNVRSFAAYLSLRCYDEAGRAAMSRIKKG